MVKMLGERGAHPGAAIVGALALVLALTGAALSKDMLDGAQAGALRRPIATSFGSVVIDDLQVVGGLTAKDLAGMTHGINGLVSSGRARVQLTATFTNDLDHAIAYSPSQLRLRSSKGGRPLRPATSSIGPGRLRPRASIQVSVGFVVPEDGAELWLHLVDRGADPIAVPLNRTTNLRRGSPQPHHGSGGVGR